MTETAGTGKKPRVASGILWAGISQGGRVLIQLLGLAVLSRLLPPSDFGLVAIASIFTNFAGLVRDMGTSAAVIQREQLNDSLLDTIFWFNIAVGVALAVIVVLLALPASIVFGEPRLQSVLISLAIALPLASIGAIHQALLERALRFQTLAHIELVASILGLGVGTAAAWRGAGPYSLVLTTIVTVTVGSLLLWIASRWRPTRRWRVAEARSLIGFSGNLTGFQIVNYFARNADTMLIGRFLGTDSVGWYNMAYKLMLFPVQNLSTVVSRALLPVLSRTQKDHEVLRTLYLRAVGTIALITSPLMIGLWVVREPFVLAILGDQWIAVSSVLAWLAPVGLSQSLVSPVGLLYMATGRTDVLIRAGTGVTVVVVAAMLIGLPWGYVGVAAAYAIANLLITYPAAAIPFALVGLKFRDFLRAVRAPLAAAVTMGVILWGALAAWGVDRQNPLLQLSILVAFGATLFLCMAFLFLRPAMIQAASILKDFLKGIPLVRTLAKRVFGLGGMQAPTEFSGSREYWEARYAKEGTSGVGSYGKFATFKAEVLNAFVAENDVRSVLEFGCGDGSQLKLARYPLYTGIDVSQTAVERCRRLFADDASKSFTLESSYNGDTVDLVLSLDVIFHLVEDDVFDRYMRSLFACSSRYVIIYSSDFDDNTDNNDAHVRHRNFSDWVLRNCPSWKLVERIPNKYPYEGDNRVGSFADFFIYRKTESSVPN
jgi:O-antigen/teichoic acid export membrane protein